MRSKTNNEKEFNKFVTDNTNKKAYEATDFDTNKKLKIALESFIKAKTWKLKEDQTNIMDFPEEHNKFIYKDDDRHLFGEDYFDTESDVIHSTKKLFKITKDSVAKKIADNIYHQIVKFGHGPIINSNTGDLEDGLHTEEEKINKFHKFCKDVNNSKKFLEEYFPRIDKFTTADKTKAVNDLIKMEKSLTLLEMDTYSLKEAIDFFKEYDLHQRKKCKINYLLSLDLPNIKDKSIAKKIIENLESPYF